MAANKQRQKASCASVPKNKRVVVKKVNHPGTKAQPFMRPALVNNRKFVRQRLRRDIETAKDLTSRAALISRLNRTLKALAILIRTEARKLAPKDTRLLSRSINERRTGELEYTIGTNVAYAKFVEEGTRPHVILPKRKKALCFRGNRRGSSRGSGRGRRR